MKTPAKAFLVYISCPSRLTHLKPEIMKLIARQDKGGVHPFNAYPYEFYEGGILGRDKSMEACCRLVSICDEFALFGISEGTLLELEYHLNECAVKVTPQSFSCYIHQFDPEWEEYRKKFLERFPKAFEFLDPFLYPNQ